MKPLTHITNKEELITEEPPWNGQQENYLESLNQFYSRETSSLILIQFQLTNICSVRIGALYLTRETASVAKLDAHPTGDQEVAGSTPIGSATFFRGD